MVSYGAIFGWFAFALWVACALIMIAQLTIPKTDRKTGESILVIRDIFSDSANVGEALFVVFILAFFSPIIYLVWWITW